MPRFHNSIPPSKQNRLGNPPARARARLKNNSVRQEQEQGDHLFALPLRAPSPAQLKSKAARKPLAPQRGSMADAELEEVDLDAAEAAWEEAERLTLEAAEAEAEAEARELKLRAELEAELARALLVAEEARQRARRAGACRGQIETPRRARVAARGIQEARRDSTIVEGRRPQGHAFGQARGGRRARGRGRGRGPAARDAAAERAAQGDFQRGCGTAQAEKRMKAGARRRKRDKKKSEALQKKRHEAWVARCERLRGRSRRLHLGDVVGRHERIKKAEQERAEHARRNGTPRARGDGRARR